MFDGISLSVILIINIGHSREFFSYFFFLSEGLVKLYWREQCSIELSYAVRVYLSLSRKIVPFKFILGFNCKKLLMYLKLHAKNEAAMFFQYLWFWSYSFNLLLIDLYQYIIFLHFTLRICCIHTIYIVFWSLTKSGLSLGYIQ